MGKSFLSRILTRKSEQPSSDISEAATPPPSRQDRTLRRSGRSKHSAQSSEPQGHSNVLRRSLSVPRSRRPKAEATPETLTTTVAAERLPRATSFAHARTSAMKALSFDRTARRASKEKPTVSSVKATPEPKATPGVKGAPEVTATPTTPDSVAAANEDLVRAAVDGELQSVLLTPPVLRDAHPASPGQTPLLPRAAPRELVLTHESDDANWHELLVSLQARHDLRTPEDENALTRVQVSESDDASWHAMLMRLQPPRHDMLVSEEEAALAARVAASSIDAALRLDAAHPRHKEAEGTVTGATADNDEAQPVPHSPGAVERLVARFEHIGCLDENDASCRPLLMADQEEAERFEHFGWLYDSDGRAPPAGDASCHALLTSEEEGRFEHLGWMYDQDGRAPPAGESSASAAALTMGASHATCDGVASGLPPLGICTTAVTFGMRRYAPPPLAWRALSRTLLGLGHHRLRSVASHGGL